MSVNGIEGYEGEVKVQCKVSKILSPKGGKYEAGTWGIVSLIPVKVEEGVLKTTPYGNFIAKGNLPELNKKEIYTFCGTFEQNAQYGDAYNLLFLGTTYNFDNEEDSRLFLSNILTESQVNMLYDQLEDPIEVLRNGDIDELKKVQGIGEKTAIRLIEKFEANSMFSLGYIELGKYGLTPNLIKKLIGHYKSPDVVIQKLKANPYILADEVKGIGFAKADAIALAMGMHPKDDRRVCAYIIYVMNREADKGNSYVSPRELVNMLMEQLGDIDLEQRRRVFDSMSEILWWNEDKTRIALQKVRDLESLISQELLRIKDGEPLKYDDNFMDVVRKMEEKQGWNFVDEQIEAIKTCLEHQVVAITGFGGCVDKDTEFFNGEQWKKISDYKEGDFVLQYNSDGTSELVKPTKYYKYRADYLTLIKNDKDTINQCLSDEHMVLYKTDREELKKIPFWQFREKYESNSNSFKGKIIRENGQEDNLSKENLTFENYKTLDGYMYCFEVPSGMLVLKRDNKPYFITGNSGKTTIVEAICNVLNNYTIAQCALSGKASDRMKEATGREASTIHRLLGFEPISGKFIHGKSLPLNANIVILDETSMVGGSLFYSLIQSIGSKTKLILLGDDGQLEAIGRLNIFKDILDSNVIPTVKLTKIHRQAQKSGIITSSISVRKGQDIANSEGTHVIGELKDFTIDAYYEKGRTPYKIMEHVKKQLQVLNGDKDKIQVIVPMKERGDSSVYAMNLLLQDLFNPPQGQETVSVKNKSGKIEYPYDLRVGDRIIFKKNNYNACTLEYKDSKGNVIDREKYPVFNGNIGKIIAIEEGKLIVKMNLGNKDIITVPKGVWFNSVQLGYAITCHSSQGSQFHTTIIGLDYSAYTLLSREWVYTAITRAQKNCILCCELEALQFAIKTSRVPLKNTFLKEFLLEGTEEYDDEYDDTQDFDEEAGEFDCFDYESKTEKKYKIKYYGDIEKIL